MGLTLAAVLCGVASISATPALAQDAGTLDRKSTAGGADASNLPSARDVFQSHLDAIGGDEAIASIKNMVASGTMSIPAVGLQGTMNVVQVKPDKMSTIVELPQIGKQVQVFDGEIGWMESGMTGLQKMPEGQVEQTKAQMAIESMEGFRSTFKKATIVGKGEFDGAESYEMETISKADDKMTMFFDVSTGLMRGMKTISKSPMGEIPTEIYMRDYKQVGPTKMSCKTIIKAGPQEIEMTLDDVKVNTDIPADTFKRPADL